MSPAPRGALDPVAVRSFVATIHAAAGRALDGARDPGWLQTVRIDPRTESTFTSRFPIGDVDAMAADAVRAAEDGFNVYVEPRTVDPRAARRGDLGATRGVFAFVDDGDADKGKAGAFPLIEASLVVETSPGNVHRWMVLDRAVTGEEAQSIGAAMRAAIGSDSATGKPTQPYRVAGTPNYPGPKKLARGRTVAPTRLLSTTGRVFTRDELVALFPPVAAKTAGHVPGGTSGRTSATVDELVAEAGPDRSGRFFAAVLAAVRAGMLPGDLEAAMRRHPAGCASKYLRPRDRLADEIARAWGKAPDPLARPAVDPSYPDNAVLIDEARTAVREAIAAHLAADAGCRAIRVATGVGKTRIAAEMIAADVRRRRAEGDGRPFVYAVPRHKLGDEVAALFAGHGVTARVFRGRTADDPATPGATMCLDVEAVQLALSLGAPVSATCCRGKHPETGTNVTCPSFDACAYQAQLRDKPDVWIVPHQSLFHAQAALGEPAGVVVDEGFWQAGLWAATRGLTLEEVGTPPALRGEALVEVAADVAAYRAKLGRALARQDEPGGVARRHLAAEGIDAETCTAAIAAEWRLKGSVDMWPGMGQGARRAAAKAAKGAKHVQARVRVWGAARGLLNEGDARDLVNEPDPVSGRLILVDADTDEGTVRTVRTRGVRPIAKQWADAPTLLLDATLPDMALIRWFYPHVEVVADVQARTPHARVRQAVGAPTSATKLMRSDAERNLAAVRRAVLHRFLDVGRGPTLVVAQMKVAEWLKKNGLPDGIAVAHFNAISGLDAFKDVRLLIVVGRTLPTVHEVEGMAGAITGLQPVKTAEPAKGGPRWYDKATLGLRLADGTGYAVEADRHPDPMAEAVRWQVCEGEIMQAIGRARAVNRTAGNPVDVEVWNDACLPLTLDAVTPWDEVPAGREVAMALDGIALESPADMAACWPGEWETEKAARRWREDRTLPQNPIKSIIYREMGQCGLRYRHPGERQKWRKGWYAPAVLPGPRAWLEVRLGVLAGFERETG